MATYRSGLNPPTPPEHFDLDHLVVISCDDMFEPNPDFVFADSFREMPLNPFDPGPYMLADANMQGHGARPLFDWSNGVDAPNKMARQRLNQDNGSAIGTQNDWTQMSEGTQGVATNDEGLQWSHSDIVDSRGDALISRFGMVTPPEGSKMRTTKPKVADQKLSESPPTNEISDASSKAPCQREPKKKARKGPQAAISVDNSNERKEQKEQYREKNKLAAAKCRNKKRHLNDEIETQARDLEDQNKVLKQELRELRNFVLYYKDQILRHSPQECGCTQLHEYSMDQCARLLQQAHRPLEDSTCGQFDDAQRQSVAVGPNCNDASPILPESRDTQQIMARPELSLSPVNEGMETGSHHSEGFVHNYDVFASQFVSGDEVTSLSSTAGSPDDMSELAGSADLNLIAPNNDMFQNPAFDMAWSYT